jgi:hypothetical protein
VRIGTALVVGFDAGDGFVEPRGAEGHGELVVGGGQNRIVGE